MVDNPDISPNLSAVSTSATHAALEDQPLVVGPSLTGEFNRIRPQLLPKACFRLEDSHFEFDSSFILPLGLTFDAGPLKTLLDKHPGSKLGIFGHADPVGDDDYNKSLSGRRAQSVFGLLVRDIKLWEDLYFRHDGRGKDKWGVRSVQIMLNRVGPTKTGRVDGTLDTNTRKALEDFETEQGLAKAGFNAKEEIAVGTFRKLAVLYMDAICTDDDGKEFLLKPEDFLARGKGKDGKGDYQGCSEFNPLLVFSKDEKAAFDRENNKEARNQANQPNRRVMILLFRPGSRVDPARWPCPSVKEGVAGCRKRFFSDGDRRRANQDKRRKFEETEKDPSQKGTFACRFYERIILRSPCERVIGHFIEVQVLDGRDKPVSGVTLTLFKPDETTEPATTNSEGVARWIELEAGQHRVDFEGRGQFLDEILEPLQPDKRERKKENPFDSPGEGPLDEEGSNKEALDASSIAPRA